MTSSKRVSLPESWILAELGELLTAQYGKALPEAQRNDQGSFPVIGSSGIVGKHDQFCVDQPCVVIGRKGSAGSVHLLKVPSWPIDTAYYVTPPPEIDLHYLYYLLGSLQLVQLDKSTAIPSLSRDDLYRVQIPIAPSTEQTRIVEKLEELLFDLEAGVAELKAAQKKLALYRQSLLKAAVEGALTADWRARRATRGEALETGADLLARILTERRTRWEARQLAKFKEQCKTPPKGWQAKYPEPVQPDTTNLSSLPAGWIWASLDMLGEIVSGVAKGSKQAPGISLREVPYLRVANVQRGFLDLSEIKKIMASERDIEELTLLNGDVLFNEGGDRDKLGRGWVWRDEVAQCIHQNHVFRMRPYLPEVLSEFVSHHGNTFGKSWFQQAGKQTTNLASINMGILRAFPVPVPPVDEAREILERVSQEIEAIKLQEASIELGLRQSAAQRKNLLKAAFSGRLVPQDPNDEPASALLARIRAEREARSTGSARRTRSATHA